MEVTYGYCERGEKAAQGASFLVSQALQSQEALT
jgi:hypothetical protein